VSLNNLRAYQLLINTLLAVFEGSAISRLSSGLWDPNTLCALFKTAVLAIKSIVTKRGVQGKERYATVLDVRKNGLGNIIALPGISFLSNIRP
jgi:hypothetical protein